MKKGLYRPKQQKSFFDNYKALIAAMAFLILSLGAGAQAYDSTKVRQPNNTYGSDINNLRAKYSMILPKDSTHLAVLDSGGIAYKNGGVYFWNGYRWVTIATGTTPTDYWSISGNTGISNSNFLGAINNVPTRIRSNNIELAYFNGDDYRTVINNGAAMSYYSLGMNYGMVGVRYAVTSYTSATKKIVINGIDLTSRILVNDLLEGFEQDVLTDEFDATVSTVTFTGGNTEIVLTTDPIGGNATNMWFVDITTKYTSISRYGFGVGHLSVAQGNYSTSIGNRTWAYGNYSTALGYISNATGNYSVSIGASVNATGDYSFAMGNGTTASGLNSFSLGNTSTASGSTSATLNSNNTSSGQNSFSANYGNTASGASSFAMGEGNKSKSYGGAVIGTYNDSTNATSSTAYSSTNRAFQIGVGTADNARSNAMTVLFSGKTTLNKYGVGTFTGTPAYTLQVNSNGDIIEGAVITNPVTGTGTANEISYWTGTTAIGSLTTATYPSLTELSYVKGVTSAVQTQLNARLQLAGGTMTGNLLFTDNTYDIGASGATRPRTGYFGTSLIAPVGTFATSVTSPLLIGGTAANDDITIQGTTNATRTTSYVNLQPNGGNVGIGTATPDSKLQVVTSGNTAFRVDYTGTGSGNNYLDAGTASAGYNYLRGNTAITGGATTGTGANAPFSVIANSLTSGNGADISSSSLTTGNLAAITSTSTVHNNPNLFKIQSAGVNGTASKTTNGLYINIANTGTTPVNNALIVENGNVGIGTASPSAKLHTISTTEQLRLGYDASNYYSTTVGSTGIATFNAVGSGSSFEFSDRVAVPKLKGNSSTPSIAVGTGAASVSLSTNSTDLAGEMVINTDAVTAAGATIATVTFSTAYSTAPFVTFSATNDDASSTNNNWYVVPTTTGFAFKSFSSGNDPLALTTLKFSYHVIQ